MSNNCGILWPEKFNGNEKNLKVFSYSLRLLVRSISGKPQVTILVYSVHRRSSIAMDLQRINANEPAFMLKYYQTLFHKRVLSENESLQVYVID